MFGLRISRNASDTERLEAFSDGVLAIAITLLILDVHLPQGAEHVGAQLRHLWPHYVAFLTAFLTIAVMWANHHDLFRLIDKSDRGLQFCNAALLLAISFLPFPTTVLAEHMRDAGADRQAALLAYGATMVLIALAFNALWRYVKARGLLHDGVTKETIAAIDRAYTSAPFIYAAALPLSFFGWWLSVCVWVGLAVFWQFFSYAAEEEAVPSAE